MRRMALWDLAPVGISQILIKESAEQEARRDLIWDCYEGNAHLLKAANGPSKYSPFVERNQSKHRCFMSFLAFDHAIPVGHVVYTKSSAYSGAQVALYS